MSFQRPLTKRRGWVKEGLHFEKDVQIVKRTSYSLAKTVGKAFGLLEALAAKQPARPPELAAQLTISRSNVHRLLATLEQLGYVEKTE